MPPDELKDFRRALVVVAHPDDAEFGCAGTVALWTDRGVEVTYVVCTDGASGAGDPTLGQQGLVAVRQAEQREAAKVLGVREVVFLGHPDGGLRPSEELRLELVRLIRRHRPDRLVCQNAVRHYGNVYGNHPDHLAAGQAALEALYPYSRNRFAYPHLLDEGLEPHVVREVLVAGTEAPDYFVEVSESLERKLEALACHRSQQRPGDDVSVWVRRRLAQAGEPHGMAFAESFRRIDSG
ncbi:MAG: PIG-L deacetylase family protein [Candidatus Dormibacteria bacterium]